MYEILASFPAETTVFQEIALSGQGGGRVVSLVAIKVHGSFPDANAKHPWFADYAKELAWMPKKKK